ncbi:DHA1 family multidrug resistance protein B-like MFS transporter [Salirhabdus euzebyi]|uniref:DHA1 family multidrug resistance protein B-like MFS transporter n=1 Tax=Salirhabdus euzebyi TaxID=394506 RepID=A0A841PWI1_9BACI|nr:MFS transporter [Salirhabdus euzebyi]MBB6451676.1 DHA1 family multidrug resistance protein B-like MFS transporter [Salirhabdus euzebyi]
MKFKDFHPNIKLRIIFGFFSEIIGSMIFPFMAIYFAIHFGAKLTGILLIVNIIIGSLVGIYGGYLSDIMGRKKLMVTAEVIRAVSLVVMTLANSPWFESPTITFLMFLVGSICWGIEGPAMDAMLIDVSKPEQRKLMYAIMYWSANLSIAIGGAVGAFLFKDYLFELFIGMTVMSIIVAVVLILFIEESYVPKQTIKEKKIPSRFQAFKDIGQSYKTVMKDRVFILFVIAGLFIQSLEFQLTNYIAVKLHEHMPEQNLFQWSIDGIQMTGILRTENTVLVVLFAAIVMKLIMKYKDKHVYLTSIVLFTIGYTAISYFDNMWILLVAMLIATIGELMRVPVQQSYLAAIPPDDKRSSYMAVNAFTYQGSMILASLFVTLGAILSKEMMSTLLLITGVIGFVIINKIIPSLEQRVRNQEGVKEAVEETKSEKGYVLKEQVE